MHVKRSAIVHPFRALAAGAVGLILVACALPRAPTSIALPGPAGTSAPLAQLPDGYAARLYADGLHQPTTLALGPAPDPLTHGPRRLYIAQLNGGENDGSGQIIAIDEGGGAPVVVLNKLLKPTGLAWFNDALYVVAARDVLRYTARDGKLSEPDRLVQGVPFNGRSLGHIRVGPSPDPLTGEDDVRLYYESSGGDPTRSGYLYSMRLDGSDQRILARGLKNAYATAWEPGGGLYITEIGDSIDSQPLEEINLVRLDGDYGWPNCAAGTTCNGTLGALATFPPHSTPTGMVWWEGALIVTLWGPTDPHVARVDPHSGSVSDFARGLHNPIDIVVSKQGTLLLLDYAGRVLEISRPRVGPSLSPPQPSPTPG